MSLAVAAFIRALPIDLEVRDAVDAVRIFLLVCYLHPAPKVLADVEFDSVNLRLVGKEDVFRRDVGGPRVAGIVVGVGQPGGESVAILGAAQDFVFLIPLREGAVVPLLRILLLMVSDQERGSFLNHGFERLGDEELERRPQPAVLDLKHVLAQVRELHPVDLDPVHLVAEEFDFCRCRMLSLDGVDAVLSVQRDHGRQVARDCHPRHDHGIEFVLLEQHVAHSRKILRPLKSE